MPRKEQEGGGGEGGGGGDVQKYQSPGAKRLLTRARRNRRRVRRDKREKNASWVKALQRKYSGEGDKFFQRQQKKKKNNNSNNNNQQEHDDDDDDDDYDFDSYEDDDDDDNEDIDSFLQKDKKSGSRREREKNNSRTRRHDDDDAGEGEQDGLEVEEEIDEERMETLNKAQPLEAQLFLRGLPSDVDETSVRSLLADYGKVRRVLFVQNKLTKRQSGSAFIHFDTEKSADAAYQAALRNAQEVTADVRGADRAATENMSHHQAKKLLFKIQQDRFTSKDPFVSLNNTRVSVMRPMDRNAAQDLSSAGKEGQNKKEKRTVTGSEDPRNLYLLEEGMILPGTRAAQDLNPKFLASLQRDYELRKQQLRNVTLFVSKTRLSVRNIPREVSAADLRGLFLGQVRDLIKSNPALKPNKKDKTEWGKFGPIKNIKILVDSAGVSRGYGFVEFTRHEYALHVLRLCNNNPTLFGPNRRLVVAFAIENINAIQKLERLKKLKKDRLENSKSARGGFVDLPGDDVDPTALEEESEENEPIIEKQGPTVKPLLAAAVQKNQQQEGGQQQQNQTQNSTGKKKGSNSSSSSKTAALSKPLSTTILATSRPGILPSAPSVSSSLAAAAAVASAASGGATKKKQRGARGRGGRKKKPNSKTTATTKPKTASATAATQ